MKNEQTGETLNDDEVFKQGMQWLSESACWFYEVEKDDRYKTLAWMVDNCLKYGECILKDIDPRSYDWELEKFERGESDKWKIRNKNENPKQ